MPKPYLNPNFDPRNTGLPEIPVEIKDYKRKMSRQRQIILIILIAAIIIIAISLFYFGLKKSNNQYHFIKIVSVAASSTSDTSPGPDIESMQIKVQNLSFFAEKVASTSKNFSDQKNNNHKDPGQALGAPSNIENPGYTSLGNKDNYIVFEVKPNLQDPNLTSLTINEISANNIKEQYDLFISTTKNGPWDYLGRQAGTATINLKEYFKK
jgi:hypothetical protein